MYEPVHFVEKDPARLHALIHDNPLGLLISSDTTGIQANPLPFLLNPNSGKSGTLLAHMAKANPQWRHIEGGASVLVVFQGPDAYVTPSWYAAKKEHGKVVPTWNYAMVQVRGVVKVIHDLAWLDDQITELTLAHEGKRAEPWAVGDAPERYIEMQKRAIVGIELTIGDIRGKWKVSQNRSAEDQAGVAEGYATDGRPDMETLVRDKMIR